MWTPRDLLRLDLSREARELAELAAALVPTYADEHAAAGELVADAQRAVYAAEALLIAAVAAERGRSTSWEEIGQALGVTRQAAHARFGDEVDVRTLAVLLPDRGNHWASETARDPAAAARELDDWALRHREPHSPPAPDGGLVSSGLQRASSGTRFISAVTTLTGLLTSAFGPLAAKEPPEGVTEAYAREQQLRYQVAAFDAIADEASSDRQSREARDTAIAAFEELVQLLTEQTRELLQVDVGEDGLSRFTMPFRGPHRRAVAAIDCTEVPLDPARAGGQRSTPAAGIDDDVAGWWLWPVDQNGEPDPTGAEQPLDVDRSAPREQAEHVALQEIAAWIGSDLAKGVGPFDAGGIAGPR